MIGRTLVLVAFALCAAAPAQAQNLAPADSAEADSAAAKKPSRVYYGGGIGFSIQGKVTQVGLQPHLGYKLGPKTSLGARAVYEYFKDSRVEPRSESHSYGGGIFSRYRFFKQAYGQAELAFRQYDWSGDREDTSVPFFLLGGGYAQPVGPKTYLTVDIMWDLIQDPDSPYDNGAPRVTTGISANF